MIKKHLLILLLLCTSSVYCQPLNLSWLDKQHDALGEFIKHDSKGNIIVVGIGDYDFVHNIAHKNVKVYKYDSLGSVLWIQTYSAGSCAITPYGVEIDSLDNIYIAGVAYDYCPTFSNTPEGFLVKYNANGNLKWDKIYGLNVGLWVEYRAMKLFQNKYIYVAGLAHSFSSHSNSLIARYDSSGNLNWIDTLSNNFVTYSNLLEIDQIGNIYMGGTTACCLPGYEMFLCKYDSIGNIKWNSTVIDTGFGYAQPIRIAIDDSASIFLVGQTKRNYNQNGFECVVAKLDSAGVQKWFNVFTGAPLYNGSDFPFVALTDNNGNCYVAGRISYNNLVENNAFIVQFQPNGTIGWSDVYDGLGNDDDEFDCGFIFNDSNIIVAGAGVFSAFTEGLVLRSYKKSGIINWTYENPNDCYAFASVLSSSSIYCTGIFDGTLTGGDDSLMNCRLDINLGTGFLSVKNKIPVLIYPNPFSNQIVIKQSKVIGEKTIIKISNILGEIIYQKSTTLALNTINTEDWKNGIYFIEIIGEDKIEIKRLIKN